MLEANKLTASEIGQAKEQFARDGYCIFRNVVSPERLAELHSTLAQEFDRASKTGELFSGGGLLSGHLNCFPGTGAKFVYETLQQRGIIDFMKELHPQVLRMPNVGCNFNLPGSHVQHFHTDRPFNRDFMIANVTLVDTNEENGATDIIPGTHKRLYKYTEFAMKRLSSKGQRVVTKRGDVVIRNSNTWHRGMPNRTSIPRPMLAFTWEDGGSQLADPFSIHDGNIRFLPNWFKLTPLGRLREKLFVKAPFTYAALRFVRSMVDHEY